MSLPTQSTSIYLTSVPNGYPQLTDFTFKTSTLPNGPLPDDHILIESQYVSVDPYLRGRLPNWHNRIIPSNQVAKVIDVSSKGNKSSKYKIGDLVHGVLKWSNYQIIDLNSKYAKISNFSKLPNNNIKPSIYLGMLGGTGATAYQGLFDLDIGSINKNDNILISGAAGAVGSMVGQIAKNIMNCHVIGIAGNKSKINYLINELGFDGGICYKDDKFIFNDNNTTFSEKLINNNKRIKIMTNELRKLFPNGIDYYFDNVGGWITESIWDLLNRNAKVVICGQISLYNKLGKNGTLNVNSDNINELPIINDFLYKTIYSNIKIQGFVLYDFKKWNEFYQNMYKWLKSGKLKNRETIYYGFNNIPNAFLGLFSGQNTGKMVVDVRLQRDESRISSKYW